MRIPREFPRTAGGVIAVICWFVLFPPVAFADTYVVNGGHVNASDENAGTESLPLKTIQQAAQLAQPGDTVLVHAGIYRERVAPARGGTKEQPIVYTAAPKERVVIKGSEIWQPHWRKTSLDLPIYSGDLDPRMFYKVRVDPYHTLLRGMPAGSRLVLGQVFVDGVPLREVDNDKDLAARPGTWRVNDDGKQLTLHFSDGKAPALGLVEVTTRDRIFAPYRRGLGYIHVRGFTMEHCANQFPERFWQSDSPQAGALGCRAGHHWLIENNTVRFAKSIGIDCGYEGRFDLEGKQPTPGNTGYHVIRNNRVTDNGCCGIAGMSSLATQIVGNVVERNNWNHHDSPEIGGIKVHNFVDGLIKGNLVRDNDGYGIWLDNGYRDARVCQNLVIGNRGSAVFVELGQGPVQIDNNVLANSRPSFDSQDPRADGLYTHDASGVVFVHNLVFGCQEFGSFHRKKTNRPGAGASNIVLRNNIFIDNRAGQINFPYSGSGSHHNHADHNLFSPGSEYLVNPWGEIPTDELITAVKKSTGASPKLWRSVSPRMSLEAWQKFNSWGFANFEAESATVNISKDLVLELDLGRSAHQWETAPVGRGNRDFFDTPIPEKGALAGPFQRLTEGQNRLPLWPWTQQR